DVEFTGTSFAPFGSVVLSARLVDRVDPAAAAIGGRRIDFTAGGVAYSATTNDAGVAVVAGTPLVTSGTISVSFAGNDLYLPSSVETSITVRLDFGGGEGFFAIGPSWQLGSTVAYWGARWA